MLMALVHLLPTQSQKKSLSLVTKKEKCGIQSSDKSPAAMKNAELTLVVSSCAPLKKFILFLASKTMKLMFSSGSIA